MAIHSIVKIVYRCYIIYWLVKKKTGEDEQRKNRQWAKNYLNYDNGR